MKIAIQCIQYREIQELIAGDLADLTPLVADLSFKVGRNDKVR